MTPIPPPLLEVGGGHSEAVQSAVAARAADADPHAGSVLDEVHARRTAPEHVVGQPTRAVGETSTPPPHTGERVAARDGVGPDLAAAAFVFGPFPENIFLDDAKKNIF